MARPKTGQEKHASKGVAFRVPEWMRAGMDRLAAQRAVTLSDIATEAIAAYLKRHGIRPEKSDP